MTPPQLAQFIDVKRWLPAAVWDSLEEEFEETSLGCCQVTGLTSLPLHPEQVRSPVCFPPPPPHPCAPYTAIAAALCVRVMHATRHIHIHTFRAAACHHIFIMRNVGGNVVRGRFNTCAGAFAAAESGHAGARGVGDRSSSIARNWRVRNMLVAAVPSQSLARQGG